jgi:hypothetical protein
VSFIDDDILDGDEAPAEPPSRRDPRSRGRGGGSSRGGSSRGGNGGSPLQQPRIRLLIAVGLLVVIVLILVSTIRGCQRDKLVDSYRSYLTTANAIADESTAQGQSLQKLLDNKGFLRVAQILPQVTDLSNQAQALVDRADKLDPPDRLGGPNRTLITALEYRALGLKQLPAAIDAAVNTKDAAQAAISLAAPLQVLAASDVIYRTSFVGPTENALQADKIKDAQVNRSEFFPGQNYDKTSPSGAGKVISSLKRVRPSGDTTSGTTAGTGKHGLALASTFAVRGAERKQLTGNTVSLVGTTDIRFEVTVENGGDFVESNVDVKFTYITPNNPQGTTQTQTITQIEPGEANQQKLTFPLGAAPYFTDKSTIKVEVTPVPDEKVTGNNSAQYSVEFNLQ